MTASITEFLFLSLNSSMFLWPLHFYSFGVNPQASGQPSTNFFDTFVCFCGLCVICIQVSFIPAFHLLQHCHVWIKFMMPIPTTEVRRRKLFQHGFSQCVPLNFAELQRCILDTEELFRGDPFVCTQRKQPMGFSLSIARAGWRFQNLGLALLPESTGWEHTRLLVSHALDDDPRGVPHLSAITSFMFVHTSSSTHDTSTRTHHYCTFVHHVHHHLLPEGRVKNLC